MSTPDRLTPTTHFIAPDADGDLTLWRGTREDPAPMAVQRECDTDPAVWAMVVGSLAAQPPATDRDAEDEEATRDAIYVALHEVLACDPMWIGDDGAPLDYLPEREVLIGDAVERQTDAVLSVLAARPAPDTLADRVQAVSAMIDGSYPADLPDEARLYRRVTKVAEESGEAMKALNGYVGENPRKGFTHTIDDLRAELLDVALAALGAVAHIHPGDPIQHLAEHAEFVHNRLSRALLAGRSDASPEGGA